ncbi:proline-rich receptor-like protein kinase PERK10 [Salvia miltiorrhiza]|uniref:proline-rich receptor-like protein kinase PERK10 n=1 Tax=Salvia miltiorrhiza TaxID=226208 RepID=UPI0025AD57E8|nr:proline-rich receptor-like protein kinase PERK10 [Salvia miltiorrhiza]
MFGTDDEDDSGDPKSPDFMVGVEATVEDFSSPSPFPTTHSPSPIFSPSAPSATTVTPTDRPFTDVPSPTAATAAVNTSTANTTSSHRATPNVPSSPATPPPSPPPPPQPPPPITPSGNPPPTPTPPSQSPPYPTHRCRNKKILLLGYGDDDLDPPGNPVPVSGNQIIEGETPPSPFPLISIYLRRARVCRDSLRPLVEIHSWPRSKNEEPNPSIIFGPNMSGPIALIEAAHDPSAQARHSSFLRDYEIGVLPRPQGLSLLLTTPHHVVDVKEKDRGLGQEVQLCGEPPPNLVGTPS